MTNPRLLSFLLVLALVPATSPAAPADKFGISGPQYGQSVTEVYRAPMRDGETLFVQVRRPVVPAGVKVPVILTLSPYNILSTNRSTVPDGRVAFDDIAEFYVPRGYARAIADVRGTRESSGCWDYGGLRERRDGYDLVEFLAGFALDGLPSPAAAWSSGKVGMIGASYDGTTAVMTASERPPHLAAIVPIAAIDRWYDYAYDNGVRWTLNSSSPTDEGLDTPLLFDAGFSATPPATSPSHPDTAADRYGPCGRDEHTLNAYDPSPDYDAFWMERDYRAAANGVTVPALIGHGYGDYNVKASGAVALFNAYAGPKRLVIGNWTHTSPRGTAIGAWDNLVWRWFDQFLLGLDTGVVNDPAVDSQDSAGAWHTSNAWPASTGAFDMVPVRAPVTFVDDPTVSEEIAWRAESPGHGFVRFERTTTSRMRMVGRPQVTLRASSSEPGTHWAVTVGIVTPAGTWQPVTRGFFNAAYRDGLASARPLTPGEPYTVQFALQPADHVVPAGCRIVVLVASSNAVWGAPSEYRSANTLLMDGVTAFRLPTGNV